MGVQYDRLRMGVFNRCAWEALSFICVFMEALQSVRIHLDLGPFDTIYRDEYTLFVVSLSIGNNKFLVTIWLCQASCDDAL